MNRLVLALLLAGCPAGTDVKDHVPSGETGNPDSGDDPVCEVHLIAVSPNPDAVGVYYRDPILLSFDGDGSSAVFSVTDAEGGAVALAETWGTGNNMVTLSGVLAANTTYSVDVDLCGAQSQTHFTTSSLGDLDIPAADLQGRTYSFALKDAEIIEPAVLEAFDDAKLVTPLGFMVESATDSELEFLGAVCENEFGEVVQLPKTATWDFPTADFSAAPYFTIGIDEMVIIYEDSSVGVPRTEIVLYNFAFEGSFAADGTSIEHGAIDTLVDSRGLGPLFNLEDTDGAVCDFAGDFGVLCTACPDGEPYCLHTIGVDLSAPWIEGLTLYPFDG
jgi:hypothetical protein